MLKLARLSIRFTVIGSTLSLVTLCCWSALHVRFESLAPPETLHSHMIVDHVII